MKVLKWMKWKGAERSHGFLVDMASGSYRILCKTPCNLDIMALKEVDDPALRCGNCDQWLRDQAIPAKEIAKKERAKKWARENTKRTVYIPRLKLKDWEHE